MLAYRTEINADMSKPLLKLKNFNKNCKGLGTTEKEKKQEETQTGR